jgi:hypothetical protein
MDAPTMGSRLHRVSISSGSRVEASLSSRGSFAFDRFAGSPKLVDSFQALAQYWRELDCNAVGAVIRGFVALARGKFPI